MNYSFALIIMICLGGLIGYLSGSVLFAVYFSNIFKKQDVRQVGSNNPGFTNSTRVYGKKIGFLVLILDVLKTIVPTVVFYLIYRFWLQEYCLPHATQFYNPSIFVYVPGIFAVIGHIFPIFHKFKGGKGVACYGGLCICLSPFIALIGILIIVACVLKTKKMSIGSLSAAIIVPFLVLVPGVNYLYFMYPSINECVTIAINNAVIFVPIFVACLALSALVIFRHKKNIKDLLNKTEKRII